MDHRVHRVSAVSAGVSASALASCTVYLSRIDPLSTRLLFARADAPEQQALRPEAARARVAACPAIDRHGADENRAAGSRAVLGMMRVAS